MARRRVSPGTPLRVLFFPENPTNPYQALLAGELAELGVEVAYLPARTRSQSLNLALLPLSLLAWRRRGARIVHIHWMYLFAPPWSRRLPFGTAAMELLAGFFLVAARALGYRVVWTAHNVLPNGPIFRDDARQRRRLIARCDAVIAHQESTVPALVALGAGHVDVVPEGSYVGRYRDDLDRATARARLGLEPGGRVVTFLGAIAPYKGVDVLLRAVAALPADVEFTVLVAGRCEDDLAAELAPLLAAAGERVRSHLSYVPDDEIQLYLRAADVAVFPYRAITNSGSVLLAASFGVPALVADLPALRGLPDEAVLRVPPDDARALAAGLMRVATMDDAELSALAAGAVALASERSWARAAASTAAVYRQVLDAPRP